jgi:hypothetical protein
MEDKYIIINKTELLKQIEELEKELAYHQEWYKKARDNYDRDRKFWDQADDGEMRAASDAVSTTTQEIKILKQILSQSVPLIPEIEKAFGAGCRCKDWIDGRQNYISNLKLDI